jgi:Tfp pilus assembly protein PilN
MAIASLGDFKGKKDSMIVNIEKTTSVTTIVNGEIYRVDTIDKGMHDILTNINAKENSYEKSYEICKNTTIYTAAGEGLKTEENEYLEDIMPTLYSIIKGIKDIIAKNVVQIENIYITGLASVINNIDLYFQENFINQKCEILTPYFVEKTNTKINIKDYIEVNSATALALQGLEGGMKEINFIKRSSLDKLTGSISFGTGKKGEGKSEKKGSEASDIVEKIKLSFKKSLDGTEKWLIRLGIGIIVAIILYTGGEKYILAQIDEKDQEISQFIQETNAQIATVANSTKTINDRTRRYETLVERINELNTTAAEANQRKRAIPNFLSNVMSAIPKEVQLISVANQTGKHIKMDAKAEKYQQLGYFVAKLKNDAILLNVTSTSGTKTGNMVRITIEGDLPY